MTASKNVDRALIVELHSQGLDDVQISCRLDISRSVVHKIRSGMGLPVNRPKKAPPKPRPAERSLVGLPRPEFAPPIAKQVERFLTACEAAKIARPEESERAKEAGRNGRLPLPPVTVTAPSSLERC
jgi:hypothetical protein